MLESGTAKHGFRNPGSVERQAQVDERNRGVLKVGMQWAKRSERTRRAQVQRVAVRALGSVYDDTGGRRADFHCV